LTSEATGKAEILNEFFSSVFTKEDDKDIPVPDSLLDWTCQGNKLEDIVVNPEVIESRLGNLKADKAAGDDDMSPRILKAVSKEIAVPVAMIFRKSLDAGCVPLDWKTANVAPLFKKGSKLQADNYRPISLTSQICKVVESVLRDELVLHLDRHNLIQNTQHGFRKGYSCATNLLVFLESVTASIDNKQNVDAIYLDLAKAFDKVPHQRLLQKLEAHGIGGPLHDWIRTWLSDRRQRVCLDGSCSNWRQVWSGVPQGSVLGPVLFLIFINDLDIRISSNVLKFADDTKVYCAVDTPADGMKLQDDLDTISDWAEKWRMKFNVAKCKVMHYGRSNIGYKYSMCGQPMEAVSAETDLGIHFTTDLKAAAQCKESYCKANRMLGLVSRTIRYRNPAVLLNLYKSIVRPHLEYCSVAWSPHYSKDKILLERVQHRFTRLFPNLRSLPYEDRLQQLGLWSLEERRNRADLIEIFKLVKGFTATSWSVFFQRTQSSVTRGHNWKLMKKQSQSDVRLHFFSQRVVNRWNNLVQEDVDSPSVNSFKSRLEKRRLHKMDFFMDKCGPMVLPAAKITME
jgi:ribonuclease P/MRP protein subunit RPP40